MKGNYPLFSGNSTNSAVGSISFMPKNGQKSLFAKYIANRADIDPNGMLDIIAHGNNSSIEVVSGNKTYLINSRTASRIIKNKAGFREAKSIRLLSCDTGSDPEGFAQHLANALGKPVWAPNSLIYSTPSGKYWIKNISKSQKGEWIEFKPGGIKHGKRI